MKKLLISLICGCALFAETPAKPKVSDADAKKYLALRSKKVDAENAVMMRYINYGRAKEQLEKQYNDDMAKLQEVAQATTSALAAQLEAVRSASNCKTCEFDENFDFAEPKSSVAKK